MLRIDKKGYVSWRARIGICGLSIFLVCGLRGTEESLSDSIGLPPQESFSEGGSLEGDAGTTSGSMHEMSDSAASELSGADSKSDARTGSDSAGGGAASSSAQSWPAMHKMGGETYEGRVRVNWYELKEMIRRGQSLYKEMHDSFSAVGSSVQYECTAAQKLVAEWQKVMKQLAFTCEDIDSTIPLLPSFYAAKKIVVDPGPGSSAVASALSGGIGIQLPRPIPCADAQELLRVLARDGRMAHELIGACQHMVHVLEQLGGEMKSFEERAWKLYASLDNAVSQYQARSDLDGLVALAAYSSEVATYMRDVVVPYRSHVERQWAPTIMAIRNSLQSAKQAMIPLTPKAATVEIKPSKKAAQNSSGEKSGIKSKGLVSSLLDFAYALCKGVVDWIFSFRSGPTKTFCMVVLFD